MQGLMMDYQLNVPAILRRGDELFGEREVVSRLPDKGWQRSTYADFVSRAKRLAVALRGLGLEDGAAIVRLQAAVDLATVDPAFDPVPHVERLLDEADPGLRVEVIKALAVLPPSEERQRALARAAADPNEQVSTFAVLVGASR